MLLVKNEITGNKGKLLRIPTAAIMKALLFNPPGSLFQRGEERCQADIEGSATVTLRPPNDLGYMASILRVIGVEPAIRDYPARGEDFRKLVADTIDFRPDLVVMSSTVGTVREDMEAFKIIKKIRSSIICIAKGAPFVVYPPDTFKSDKYEAMDFALCGETEFVIGELVSAIKQGGPLDGLKGIIWRKDEKFFHSPPAPFIENLDSLPFPARDLMDNHLYTLPGGESLATIQVSRGCPARCIYCLTPMISGKRLRQRSVKNVIAEIKECVEKYGISNFFFRADTFTLNKSFVIDLCRAILQSGLSIRWVANSRPDTLDEEKLFWMKKAGCWLIALGIESGSEETLEKSRKGISRDDSIRAVRLIRKTGIKVYGFFMIGFPWENERHIKETMKLAKALKCDFPEVHIAVPYPGTELYKMAVALNLLSEPEVGYNYFSMPLIGTQYLSREDLQIFRKKFLRSLYFNPIYIVKTLWGIRNLPEASTYIKRGLKLLRK